MDDELANAPTTMATPSSPRAQSTPPLETIPADRYVDRRELGRGGMGKIVTAFDRRLGRTVAIKEMRGEAEDFVARFEREIRLSAKLEHPSIVTIHDAGVWPTGEPFYVMRLVPGRSLADAIADALDLRRRLALVPNVIAVADALAYAHGKGIAHRDLKPQNVMIGEFGETVVIDWGLAKELAPSRPSHVHLPTGVPGETQLGDVLGTPAYMPPEQALGAPIDERADVYAIGAILHHVLAGTPPYEGGTTEVLDAVAKGAPPALERLAAHAPPDLLAIVRRAMAREPGDRYPSARELADDLRAFQAGQLVGAHRYSAGELVRRWLRKHRAAIGVGAIAVLALVGVGAASIYRIVQARAAAEHNRVQAEKLVEFVVDDLGDKLLVSGHSDLMATAMQGAADYYAARTPETRDERERYAEFLNLHSRVLEARGDTAGALRQARAAQQVAGSLGLETSRLEVSVDLQLADVLAASGDADGAIAQYRAAVAAAERGVAREPDVEPWQTTLAAAHSDLGMALSKRGDIDGARRELAADLALSERRVATHPDDPHALRGLAVAHDHLGLLEIDHGSRDAALAHYRKLLDLLATLSARTPTDPQPRRDLALTHTHLGGAISDGGDLAGAATEYEAGAAIDEALLVDDPENALIQTELADNLIGAGRMAMRRKQLEPARTSITRAIAILRPLVSRDPANADVAYQLSTAQAVLGDILSGHDSRGALAAYRDALAIRERLVARAPTNVQRTQGVGYLHDMIGEELLLTGDKAGGHAELETARAIYERIVVDHPDNARAKTKLDDIRDSLASCCK